MSATSAQPEEPAGVAETAAVANTEAGVAAATEPDPQGIEITFADPSTNPEQGEGHLSSEARNRMTAKINEVFKEHGACGVHHVTRFVRTYARLLDEPASNCFRWMPCRLGSQLRA